MFWTAVCGVLCKPLRSTAWMQAGGSLGASVWLELGVQGWNPCFYYERFTIQQNNFIKLKML